MPAIRLTAADLAKLGPDARQAVAETLAARIGDTVSVGDATADPPAAPDQPAPAPTAAAPLTITPPAQRSMALPVVIAAAFVAVVAVSVARADHTGAQLPPLPGDVSATAPAGASASAPAQVHVAHVASTATATTRAPGTPAKATPSARHSQATTTPQAASTGTQAPQAHPQATVRSVSATGAVPACAPVNTATQDVICGQAGSAVCGTYQTPAPLFGTLTGWRCSVEVGTGAALAVYTVQHSCAGLGQAMTCRQETISQAETLLAADGCPGPIHGTIGGAGNRIPLTVRIVGPAGTRTFAAILDTGGVDTQLHNADMLAVGLTPTTETTGSWPLASSAPVKEWTYTTGYPEVYDNGAWAPLGLGTTTIHGADVPAGVSPLIGPDVLKAGTALSTDGSAFTLTPPCAGTREA